MPGIGIGLGLGMGRASPAPAPPDPYGPELIVNGTFDSSTEPWVPNTATLSVDNGRMKFVTTNTGDRGAYQDIVTESGKTYRATAWMKNEAAQSGACIRVASTAWALIGRSPSIAAGQEGETTIEFVATGDATRISVERLAAFSQASETVYVDNVSVREVLSVGLMSWGAAALLWGGSPFTWA